MNQMKPMSFLQIMAFIWKREAFTLIPNSFNLFTKASVANYTNHLPKNLMIQFYKTFLEKIKLIHYVTFDFFLTKQNIESWQHWLDKGQTGNLVKIINKKQSWLKIDQRLNGDHLLLNNWDVATLGADSQGLLNSLSIPSIGKNVWIY